MYKLQLSRKHVLDLFLGLLVIIVLEIIINAISLFIAYHVTQITPVNEIKDTYSQQPILFFNWLLGIIGVVSPVLGGLVAGWKIKEKGWLYGGLLGIVLTLIFIVFVSYPFFLPTSWVYGLGYPAGYGHDVALKNILNQLIHAPVTIILTSIGGILGEKLYKK